MSGGFQRVSRKRPCRICHKPTWCGYTPDEGTSICMRVRTGSRRTSKNGGNIHVHSDIPCNSVTPQSQRPSLSIPIAPLEIRDAVFRELIRISPASHYYAELVGSPGGLLSRGLLARQIANYGALPRTQKERADLAAALRSFVLTNFTDYATLYSRAGVVGIPGFWQEPSGMVHIWKPRGYLMPILVIPYHDAEGFIQACQIRLHGEDIPEDGKRYRWLASPQERYGTSSGTPIHFTFRPKYFPAGGTVLFTEGALKAEVFVRFKPKARVIATTGVSCSHTEMVIAGRPYNALIGFDSDHRTNPAVCRQLARLIAHRCQDSIQHQLTTTTRIVIWEGTRGAVNAPKGIDEAVQNNFRLTAISISKWYAILAHEPLEEVKQYWSEIGFDPSLAS
jgi:hypothetical protein